MIYVDNYEINTTRLTQNPIFVVGCPRSGTTLLQSLLSTQNGLYSFPETHYFRIIIKNLELRRNLIINPNSLGEVFTNIKKYMDLEFSPHFKRRIELLSIKGHLDIKLLFEIIIYVFLREKVSDSELQHIRWIEKTPSHFYELRRIAGIYPKGKFLMIFRHPVPVVLSRKKNIPADKQISIKKLTKQWNIMIRKYEDFIKTHPDRIRCVKYEDLVTNVNRVMVNIGRFLEIDIRTEKLLKFGEIGRSIILPCEHWKNDIFTSKLQNTNTKYLKVLNIVSILIIQSIAKNNMAKYKYKYAFSLIQGLFNAIKNPSNRIAGKI